MDAPYTKFGMTLMIPVVTFTDSKEDKPPKSEWFETLWVERGEDWYALMYSGWKGRTIRVVDRAAWISASWRSRADRM